ncbi:MAG: FIST C-terminal domain-containing protein [Synergistaceae bacterium]|jgi:hypothetical protein|nr:FIST C-terminal domain-containing protein [Synergistaceae bacterium]
MIRAMTACTSEIDDVQAAVSEMRAQLETGGRLLRNTVGILTCYADFIESGAMEGICEALPFEIVGSTTLSSATEGSSGELILTLMVLTSDDVSFAVGLTDPIFPEEAAPLREAYESVAATGDAEKPALMLTFAPLLLNGGGDFYVNSFTEISGGVPNFGMIAVDHNSDYHESRVIHNGKAWVDRCAFVLVFGDVHPRFFIGSISPEKIFMEKGIVTASRGNQLRTVNDRPVLEYLRSIGLTRNEKETVVGINSFPFIVDYNDGTLPVARAMFANTPEGYAVCGGDIPVGATLSVGFINTNEIVTTTGKTLTSALASGKSNCLLMFSCIGRYFTLGYEPMIEIDKVREILGAAGVPWQLAYSGGEFCPVRAREGEAITNRSHNDTIVICAL